MNKSYLKSMAELEESEVHEPSKTRNFCLFVEIIELFQSMACPT